MDPNYPLSIWFPIYPISFIATLDDIANAIISAHNRGVEVEIVIEKNEAINITMKLSSDSKPEYPLSLSRIFKDHGL